MSDKNDDFLSFEKALRELKMRSEELKKLVSEGEIRAFRDGDSMKFRRDDVAALTTKAQGDAELSFADSLEDDTGMVTEQISDEDTLLAEDDIVVEATPARSSRTASRTPRAAAAPAAAGKEPGWVTAAAFLACVVMVCGFMLCYDISQESNPKDTLIGSFWAQK